MAQYLLILLGAVFATIMRGKILDRRPFKVISRFIKQSWLIKQC